VNSLEIDLDNINLNKKHDNNDDVESKGGGGLNNFTLNKKSENITKNEDKTKKYILISQNKTFKENTNKQNKIKKETKSNLFLDLNNFDFNEIENSIPSKKPKINKNETKKINSNKKS
jgi:hypothetical protein